MLCEDLFFLKICLPMQAGQWHWFNTLSREDPMKQIFDAADDVWAKRKQEAWEILGDTMTKLPVRYWEKNMLFSGVSNVWWRKITGGFPATKHSSGTHPLFVLGAKGNYGFQVCPCSSSGNIGARFIRRGCKLLLSVNVTDRDSFLVERFAFSLPMNSTFSDQPGFKGKVPETCIHRSRK